jgi:potassium uptake TrkH family protein
MALNRLQKTFMDKLTPTQFVVLGYAAAMAMCTVLLMLPISLRPGADLTPLDALFTAVSAISVTGLTVVNTLDTFSVFGTFVLMAAFQVGGIGVMALGTFLWLILGRNVSLSYRRMIMIDHNRNRLSGLVVMIRHIFLLALAIEAAGTALFAVYFYLAGYVGSWAQAIYYGLFHAVSSYTNAGFDIFGDSLHRFAGDYFVQIVTMILIVLGAIGFPVLLEVREYVLQRNKRTFRFSLYTKLTTSTFAALILIGAVSIYCMESVDFPADKAWHENALDALFHSVTTRSAGLTTMDVNGFNLPTQFLMAVLMFIGASPSSVGGGIRTTTFAVVLLSLYTYAKGKYEVRAFRRAIKDEDIKKSFVVFSTAAMLVVSAVILIVWVEADRFPLIAVIFEVCSAFGTSGLSTGITAELSAAGQALIMALMFIGRIGILSLLFIFRTRNRQEMYRYPQEDLIIGQ